MNFKFSINGYVKVKLTDYGIEILKRRHEELNEYIVSRGNEPLESFELVLDEEGYYKTQLWSLMDKFGHTTSIGSDMPFETQVIFLNGNEI